MSSPTSTIAARILAHVAAGADVAAAFDVVFGSGAYAGFAGVALR